ncbi:hypothetical protein A9Q88_11975 [Gammaproteobacteria bacterium 50_400_T64]|nr:hypothetical protein A9Q88_11975 [Gammaproteobacteria bacterium 50_400_T64]
MTINKLDFKQVASLALGSIDAVLSAWVGDGKRQGHEYVALNPTRSDQSSGSFSINMNTGQWADFSTDDKGGDLVSLVAYIDGITQGEACKNLANFLGITETGENSATKAGPKPAGSQLPRPKATSAPRPQSMLNKPRSKSANGWQSIVPVPDPALRDCPALHPTLGQPSQTWEYLDANGLLSLKVLRFDIAKNGGRKKEYRPLTYGAENGKPPAWSWKQPAQKGPLYRLDCLATGVVTAPIILTEGEKAADAAQLLFPNAVAMTWLSGSKAIGKADFSPLRGREVWYWPDNDKAGRDSVTPLAEQLQKQAVKSLAIINIALFEQYSPSRDDDKASLGKTESNAKGWPVKADAADALAMGWTADHIALLVNKGLIGDALPQGRQDKGEQRKLADSKPDEQDVDRFKSTKEGLFYFDSKADAYRRMGGRLDVLGRSRNQQGDSWGLLVSFDDFDGESKEWNIPASLLVTDQNNELLRGLAFKGYHLLSGREPKKQLTTYINDHATTRRIRLVENLGWHGDAFMTPAQVIGKTSETLQYYSGSPAHCKISQNGTLDQWRDNVAFYAVDNSRLTFAICAAFAAPLLDIIGSETCGFHFVGPSGRGKSVISKVAASVYGHPEKYRKMWRTTDNALEAVAAEHNDVLLILDEISQIDPRIAGEAIYLIGNGLGKMRSQENGTASKVKHQWRLVLLSFGEHTLAEHMAEAKKKPKAGMEARLLSIPAIPHSDTATAELLGVHESSKGFAGGAALGDHLEAEAVKQHGTAFLTFIQSIAGHNKRGDMVKYITEYREYFKKQVGIKSGGHADRAADKFALVAAAGEYATQEGITGWQKGWATSAAKTCFYAWADLRGGTGGLENTQILDHLRLQFIKYGESRFTRWPGSDASTDDHAPRTMDRLGFRKTETEQSSDVKTGKTTDSIFYLASVGFKELCEGINSRAAAQLLNEMGALETDKGKRLTKKVRLPGSGDKPVNCYVIRLSVLMGEKETMAPSSMPEVDLDKTEAF